LDPGAFDQNVDLDLDPNLDPSCDSNLNLSKKAMQNLELLEEVSLVEVNMLARLAWLKDLAYKYICTCIHTHTLSITSAQVDEQTARQVSKLNVGEWSSS